MDPSGQELNVDQLFDLLRRKLHAEGSSDGDCTNCTVATERLHKRVEDATRILSLVRLRVNSTLPIHQLPPEILKYIFEMTQDYLDTLFPPMMNKELDGLSGWLVVTQVCRHWRHLALETPSLWRNVVLSSRTQDQASMRESFIHRSRPHRIHVTQMVKMSDFGVRPNPENLTPFKKFLLENSDRLEALHVSSARHLHGYVWELLEVPFPVLTSLHLDLFGTNDSPVYREGKLPQILAGGVPNLKRLSLSHAYICTNSVSRFRQLTHLSLRDVHIRPHITDFLATLEACPHLEVICLHNANPARDRALPAPSNTITLPFLRTISISNSGSLDLGSCNILRYLTLQANTRIVISAGFMLESPMVLEHMLPHPDSLHRATVLDIRSTGDECLVIHDEYAFADTAVAANGLELLPLCFPNVKELRLSRRIHGKHWGIFLASYPNLSVIKLHTSTNYIPLMNTLDSGATEAAVCPNLTRLIVKDTGQATSLTPALQKRVMGYQQSRVTTIERGNHQSYQLIVEPNESSLPYVAKPIRRKLPPREEEFLI